MKTRSTTSAGLWIGVAAVFGLMLLAWSVLFVAAHKANVETVPLAPRQPA